MERNKWFELLYVILILSVIVFMIWIANFMQSNAKECLSDPISYFETKNKGVTCSCFQIGEWIDPFGIVVEKGDLKDG